MRQVTLVAYCDLEIDRNRRRTNSYMERAIDEYVHEIAPTHDDERKRAEFRMDNLLTSPRRSDYDAIMRQAIKLIHRCEQNANRRNYSNPKTRNRYLDAAMNGRRKAIRRLDALLHKFSEVKPISP